MSPAELDAFVNRTFDPFITPTAPVEAPAAAPPPAPDPNQTSFDFGSGTANTPSVAAPDRGPLIPPAPMAPLPTTTSAPPMPATSASSPTANTAARAARDATREPGAAHRALFTADNQPAEGVERVNPDYPPPPGTPAQIDALKDEIVNQLAARAQAEQAAQHQSARAAMCEANQAPIAQTVQDTAAGLSAVQAHDEAVARHAAVAQEQQQRHAEAQGLTAGYPSRAAGLAALSVPLAAWAGFTSLASHLPGEAGDKMLQMNEEAEQMQNSFAQMGAQMAGVDNGAPNREAELSGNQQRLAATGEQAASSAQELQSASDGAAALQQANEAAQAEATAANLTCTEQAQQHGDAAIARKEQADSLAEQMRVWASAHTQARQQAIKATEQRLTREGHTVVRNSEP